MANVMLRMGPGEEWSGPCILDIPKKKVQGCPRPMPKAQGEDIREGAGIDPALSMVQVTTLSRCLLGVPPFCLRSNTMNQSWVPWG